MERWLRRLQIASGQSREEVARSQTLPVEGSKAKKGKEGHLRAILFEYIARGSRIYTVLLMVFCLYSQVRRFTSLHNPIRK
uniref:Uncharacterized protein n=1 Tax=Parascaris equorum TaxID=6256 RepID=A0A914RA99_PAREQ